MNLSQLNKKPIIVATLSGHQELIQTATQAAKQGSHCIEIRIDQLSPNTKTKLPLLLPAIKKSCRLPIIGTFRCASESMISKKRSTASDQYRKKLLFDCMPALDAVDIEINSNKINRTILHESHRLKKKVILSYHDFKGIPKESDLDRLVKKFKSLKGDILKIAATPKHLYDVCFLLDYCRSLKNTNRIFIAMGDLGAPSRVYGFSFGSCMTYGHMGKHTAPGQLSVKDLTKDIHLFYK